MCALYILPPSLSPLSVLKSYHIFSFPPAIINTNNLEEVNKNWTEEGEKN